MEKQSGCLQSHNQSQDQTHEYTMHLIIVTLMQTFFVSLKKDTLDKAMLYIFFLFTDVKNGFITVSYTHH